MKLLSMKLTNFKGVRQVNFDFPDGGNYNIYGANETGKSTTFDALTWLLFGKDSADATDFSVKTIVNGEPLHHAEHSVECAFLIKGMRVTLKKVFKEKWQKPRGKLEAQFAGHTTDYYVNDVPKSATEYKRYINEIIAEKTFKVLTSPLFFNEKLKDTERRTILMDIIGGVDQDAIIAENHEELKELQPLLQGRKVEDFKLIVKQSLAKTKKEIDGIEPAIKALQSVMIPGADLANMGLYQASLERNAKENERLLQEITKLRAGNVDDSLETRKADLNRRLSDLRNKDDEANRLAKKELHARAAEAGAKCLKAGSRVNRLQRAVAELEAEIQGYNQKREKLLQSFKEIQQRKFISKPIETICPTCGQEIPPESIEAAQAAQELQEKQFNHGKAELLKEINEKGKANNEAKQKAEAALADARVKLDSEETWLNDIQLAELAAKKAIAGYMDVVSPDIAKLETELAGLEAQINQPDEAAEKRIAELTSQRETVMEKQREAQNKLNDIEQNRKCQERIREQQEKEAELSATYTSLQRQAYLCDRYSRCLTDYIDRKVADKFKLARFTFFRDNITNDGVKECCEVVIDGVPYHDINNAKKINIGLDIINTLCKYYNVSVPVFVDNAEGVTRLIDTDLQIIRLVVSPEDKTLRVEKA